MGAPLKYGAGILMATIRKSISIGLRSSLCNLRVLGVSVVDGLLHLTTTESQRTQRLHRGIFKRLTPVLILVVLLSGSLITTKAQSTPNDYLFNDSHFHLTNYIQEGIDIHDFLKIMGNKAGRVALFGIPLQQQWSYRIDENRGPTYYLNSDAPLYYYSFTDAWIATAYKSLSKEEQARFDPMITGFNPAQMYALFKRHPHTTFIWAHIGVGRIIRPVKEQTAIVEEIISDPQLRNVNFDISWDEVAKYVVAKPESLKNAAAVISRNPDRFLFGTDEVAPATQEKYLRVYNQYEPLWKSLTPEVSEKVRKQNYERIFDEARRKVRSWEATHIK